MLQPPSEARRLSSVAQQVLAVPVGVDAAVFGVPGSGKTELAARLAVEWIARGGLSPEQVLVLAATRDAATRIRDSIALDLGQTIRGELVRTAPSVAFELAQSAQSRPVVLMTGAEHDRLLSELLEAAALDDGGGWPARLGESVRSLRCFRDELRELLDRACEHGVTADELAAWGAAEGRPEWAAAARVWREVGHLAEQSRDIGWYSSAELTMLAVAAVRSGAGASAVAGGVMADGAGRAARLGDIRALIVDDAQEATHATVQLLAAFAARGASVVAFGEPDVASNGFRGGRPDLLGNLAAIVRRPTERFELDVSYRGGPALRALGQAVAAGIGTALGGTHRKAWTSESAGMGAAVDVGTVPERAAEGAGMSVEDGSGSGLAVGADASGREPDAVLRVTAASRADEVVQIAEHLRAQHLLEGVPWKHMAVVVRSGTQLERFEQGLRRLDVPIWVAGGRTRLGSHAATRALLTAAAWVMGIDVTTGEVARDLLDGPLGGIDSLGMRHLVRACRQVDQACGQARPAADILLSELADGEGFADIDLPSGRMAHRLARTLARARVTAGTGSVASLLWTLWHESGLEARLTEASRGSGALAMEANRALDAVVALFAAAERQVERAPTEPAAAFVRQALDAAVPEDTLAARSGIGAVTLGTPAALIGRTADIVVVAGLQDSLWPNLRPRGTLLDLDGFTARCRGERDATRDPGQARAEVRSDEVRLFLLAVSRAEREVVLSAVANEEEMPSALHRMATVSAPVRTRPMHLRRLVGSLRRSAVADPAGEAVAALAWLAASDVAGAHPDAWYGVAEPSTVAPLATTEGPVSLSPSQLESAEISPMGWFLSRVVAPRGAVAATVGTLVHALAEEAAVERKAGSAPDIAELWRRLGERWAELHLGTDWPAQREFGRARALVASVDAYLTEFAAAGGQLLAAEQRFSVTVGDLSIVGTMDRVECDGEGSGEGSAVVVDLKTGRTAVSAAATVAHPQLAAYQLALRHGAIPGVERVAGAKLVYLDDAGARVRVRAQQPLDDVGEAATLARFSAVADAIAGPTFAVPAGFDEEDSGPGSKTPWPVRMQLIPAVSA